MPPKLALSCAISFRQDNPKKPGSKAHTRYEQYKKATTVDEALKFGADKADLNHDLKAGYLSVEAADTLAPTSINAPITTTDSLGPAKGAKTRSDTTAQLDGVCAKRRVVAPGEQWPEQELQENQPPQLLHNSEQHTIVHEAPSQTHSQAGGSTKRHEDQDIAPVAAAAAAALPAAAGALETATADAAAAANSAKVRPPADSQPRVPCGDAVAGLALGEESAAVAVKRPPESEVDLSFATFDNKPLKFVKRTMGEARRLLCNQGVEEGRKLGYEFKLLERTSLAKWAVQLRDLNSEGELFKDLQRMGLDTSVDLEFSLPDGFPLEPPFVRVVYPQLSGAYVFKHGGICFEPLTSKGWAPSMTLPNLAVSIKGILDYGGVRCSGAGDRALRKVSHFTEVGARNDHKIISTVHRDGSSNTYGRLNWYTS